MNEPRAEYERRRDEWRARIDHLDRLHLLVSNLRLVAVGLLVLSLWLSLARGLLAAAWSLLPAVTFAVLVVVHARLLFRAERARRAERLYERGLARLAGKWIGQGRDGSSFLNDHPYARDLDLFGRASLFELVNTARTESGEHTLAAWFADSADLDEISARQAAVAELRPMLDFREDLSVVAAEANVGRTSTLAAWIAARDDARLGQWFAFLFTGCAVVTVTLAVVAALGIGVEPLLIWLLVEYAVVFTTRGRVEAALLRIEEAERDLELLTAILERIERQVFSSPRLQALRARLETEGISPGARVAALRRLIGILDSTRNAVFAPIAYPLLIRSQTAVAIERWRRRYGAAVLRWMAVVGEVEALCAFGAYAFEHPNDPFPILLEDGPLFDATAIRHPLMHEDVAVANDLTLGGSGPHVMVVSGSNMSGKSTLLRLVGLNVVLAMAGAPVRAERLALSRLALGATLRIEDSLEEGRSRFYAEILRLRTIVETAKGAIPLLFLLDEILHGTNSYDRRIGAEGIIRALVSLGAIGLVTTHDLALTELPALLGPAAANRHFEDRLENGKLVFDYRMRPGVVEHSNALALMRAVGLDV